MEVDKFEFAIKMQDSFGLADFKGFMFRARCGYVPKRTICIMREGDGCELWERYAYTYLSEARNERKENVARPFLLEPALTNQQFYLKNEHLCLNRVLFVPWQKRCECPHVGKGVVLGLGGMCIRIKKHFEIENKN